MRILFVCFNLINQGTYWRAFHLGAGLCRLGHDVTLIATSRKSKRGVRVYHKNNMTIVETPDLFNGALRSGWDPWNTINRILFLSKQSFDIVHAFEARPTVIYPSLFAKQKGAQFFMDWCDWLGKGGSVEERPASKTKSVLRAAETYYEERFRSIAKGHTVICSTLYEKARQLGLPAESLFVLPNGSDTESFFPIEKKCARQALDLPEELFLVGYMGTIYPRDAAFLLDAFAALQRQVPNARLLWVGNAPRSIQFQNEAVHQTGYLATQDQINQYLSACDVFWLPMLDSNANRGRLPLKLMDYMAAGRPVIATEVGDVPGIIRSDQSGLVSPVDIDSFVSNTVILSKDEALRIVLSNNAREQAIKNHNWLDLTKGLDGFYQKILR